MAKETIVSDGYCTEKQEIFLKDIAEAILKYGKNGIGEICIDDVKIDLFPSKDEWHKMSLYFKIIK